MFSLISIYAFSQKKKKYLNSDLHLNQILSFFFNIIIT